MWDVGGYNKKKVNAIGDDINSTFKAVAKACEEKIDQRLVIPMSTAWYAPEAKEEFDQIDTAI
jgi:hypothetical protein